MTQKSSKALIVIHVIVAALLIAAGAAMIALKSDLIGTIMYSYTVICAGIVFIIYGAYFMINYLYDRKYLDTSNYQFSFGAVQVLIGAVITFYASAISPFVDVIVCIICAVLGVIMIQQTFALGHIKNKGFIVTLIFGAATIGASVYNLVKASRLFDSSMVNCIFLICVGVLSLISMLIYVLGLKKYSKNPTPEASTEIAAAAPSQSMFVEDEAPAPAPQTVELQPDVKETGSTAEVVDDKAFEE